MPQEVCSVAVFHPHLASLRNGGGDVALACLENMQKRLYNVRRSARDGPGPDTPRSPQDFVDVAVGISPKGSRERHPVRQTTNHRGMRTRRETRAGGGGVSKGGAASDTKITFALGTWYLLYHAELMRTKAFTRGTD